MKARGTKLIGLLLGLAICLSFAYLLTQQLPYIQENVKPSIAQLLALTGLSLMVFLLRAIMNRIMFHPLGVNASILHWTGIVVGTTLANTLPLVAGSIAKGFYLKRIHDLPYRIYAGGQIALFALVLSTNGIVGLIILATIFREQASAPVWSLFFLMACAGFIPLLPKTIQRILGKQRFPWPEWTPRQQAKVWGTTGLSQLGILFLAAAKLHLCFAMGLEDVNYTACLLFSASIAITRLISITPASIGIREFLIASVAHLIGFNFSDALIASTIDRIIDLVIVGLLTPIFGIYFKKRYSMEYQKTNKNMSA